MDLWKEGRVGQKVDAADHVGEERKGGREPEVGKMPEFSRHFSPEEGAVG